jgi:hypothetical protein
VRNWPGWHRHQTLSLLAAWFLTEETRRKKITIPALTSPQLRQLIAGLIGALLEVNEVEKLCRRSTRWLRRNEQARFYYHRSCNIMPRLKNELRM